MSPTKEEKHLNHISKYAASLATLEIGVGSLLHAFHIPFSGQILSMHQSAILAHASRKKYRFSPFKGFYISSIVAILKSLSPAGKKLGPMLSISMQGFLFSLGSLILGVNSLGIAVGAALSSLWAFIQPVLTLILFFGESFFQAIEFYQKKWVANFAISEESILLVLGAIVLIKMTLAVCICLWSYKTGKFVRVARNTIKRIDDNITKKPTFYQNKIPSQQNLKEETINSAKLAVKDLLNPLFLSSFLLMIVFFFFSRSEHSQTIWILLRPVAVAFLFFFVSRHTRFYRLFSPLQRFRWFRSFSNTLASTINSILGRTNAEENISEKESTRP